MRASSSSSSSQQPCRSPIAQRAISMQHAGDGAEKGRNGRLEFRAVVPDHLVAALHGADRSFQYGATGISETLARFEVGLFADHAITTHFLHAAVGVGDDQMACQQL